jgi:hypothetical protein
MHDLLMGQGRHRIGLYPGISVQQVLIKYSLITNSSATFDKIDLYRTQLIIDILNRCCLWNRICFGHFPDCSYNRCSLYGQVRILLAGFERNSANSLTIQDGMLCGPDVLDGFKHW